MTHVKRNLKSNVRDLMQELPVTSQFGKRPETWDFTKLGNIRKTLHMGGDIA